jgi:hypothetical protein
LFGWGKKEVKTEKKEVKQLDWPEDAISRGWGPISHEEYNKRTTPEPLNFSLLSNLIDKKLSTNDILKKHSEPNAKNSTTGKEILEEQQPPQTNIPKGTGNVTGDRSPIGSTSEFKKKYGVLINDMAKELGVDTNLLAGVILVESGGSGFVNGNLKIRFENHYFLDRTKGYTDLFTYN